MRSARPTPNGALDRSMDLFPAAAMVVGIILGAAIFVQPSEISRHVPNIPAMLAVWLLAGVLTLCGALVCAELASAFPQTGGVYIFLKEGVSPVAGFLWGWAMFWSVHSGIIAATAVIFARYVGYFTPLGDRGIQGVAIGAILLLSGVNYLGVRQGSAVQTILTSAKVLAIALILLFVFALGAPGRPAAGTPSGARPVSTAARAGSRLAPGRSRCASGAVAVPAAARKRRPSAVRETGWPVHNAFHGLEHLNSFYSLD